MKKPWKTLFKLSVFLVIAAFIFMRMIELNQNDTITATERENFSVFYKIIKYQVQESTESNSDPLYYVLSGDLKIENKSSPFDMALTFGIAGNNSIYGIKGFDFKQDEHLLKIESNSNWLSPYKVKADIAEPSTTDIEKFTGGRYDVKGDMTGAPTAFMKSFEIYADGEKIIGNTTGNAHVIHIIVNNLIQSYNSDDYVLEEYILYTIHRRSIDVQVTVNALAGATIYKYYGLETQNSMFDDLIHYNYEDGTTYSQSVAISSDSGKADENKKVTSINLTSKNQPFVLSAKLNYSPLLSTLPYISDDEPIAFTEQFGKSYFKLISGHPLHLTTGESFQWSGGYTFFIK